MGLIRKTLSVGTLGTVKGSSKKQRTAKATLAAIQEQNRILSGQPSPQPQPIPRGAKIAVGVIGAGIIVVIAVVAIAGSRSSSPAPGVALATSDVRDTLAIFDLPVRSIGVDKQGCAVMMLPATDTQDIVLYPPFTIEVAKRASCNAEQTGGTKAISGVYWMRAKSVWEATEKVAPNVWLSMTLDSHTLGSEAQDLEQTISVALAPS